MSWKRYQNELIVIMAFIFMLMGYMYKHAQVSSQQEALLQSKVALEEIKEVLALKKIWSDKKTTQKISRLKMLIPAEKVRWNKKSKKITASYKGLTDKELNTLVTKILNLPISIKKLDIQNVGTSYDLECKCQW